jgi:hypothetical protein
MKRGWFFRLRTWIMVRLGLWQIEEARTETRLYYDPTRE